MKEILNEKLVKSYVVATNDKKVLSSFFFIMVLFAVSVTFLVPEVMAEGDGILDVGQKMIKDVASTIVTISSAAALVGVGTGAFLKKFSLGKPDRIDMGNKLIYNSIWGWVLINGLLLILNFFGEYFTGNASVTSIDGISGE